VTSKVFTNHSHVVMNIVSGHVYSYDAVEQLNRKTKNFKDLITSQPFKWTDIVTLQDPDDLAAREIAKFYFMQKGQQDEVIAEITHRESKISAEAKKDTLRTNAALNRIFDEKKQIAEQKALEDAEKQSTVESSASSTPAINDLQPVRKQHDRFTSGEVAESFTSTRRILRTQNDLRPQTEEENIQDVYEMVRKSKAKGYVRLITTIGMLNLELHTNIAPRTTDNFLRLCERDYYDNTVFHRLIHNFMLQGGDPTGTGRGGKSAFEDGKEFKDEFDVRIQHSGPGVVSMANSGKNTNKSQFFITLSSCQHLDNKHSVFGRVVGGMKLLEEFNSWPTDEKDRPKRDIKLIRTEVFKNPFKEALEESMKPKVEKVVDPVATWFSNRRDPMEEHRNRNSSAVGKYLDDGTSGSLLFAEKRPKDLPPEELEYAGVATKAKRPRTEFDFSSW